MATLSDMRDQHGEFVYPQDEELWGSVARIDDAIQAEIPITNEHGFSKLLTRQARLDVASAALSEADGYQRTITSFKDMTRAELNYVEEWINTHRVIDALATRGWNKEKEEPTLKKVIDMLRGSEISSRTANRLLSRYS